MMPQDGGQRLAHADLSAAVLRIADRGEIAWKHVQ